MPDSLAKQIIEQFTGSALHQRKSLNEEISRIACVRREVHDNSGLEVQFHLEDSQLDTSVRESAMILLNGLVGRLTPPSSIWFGAKEQDEHTDSEKKALERAMRMIFSDITSANSNFYEGWSESALDGIHYGNMCMRILEGQRRKFNFTSIPIGHYIFLLDDEGFSDTVLRKYKMSADAMEGFFGRGGLPKKVLDDLDSHDKTKRETKYEVIHRIRPRKDSEVSDKDIEPDPLQRAFESIYVLVENNGIILGREVEGLGVVEKDGMYENPYVVERLFTVSGATSGEGITSMLLPKCREIQHSKRQFNQVKDSIAKRSWYDPGSGMDVDLNAPNQRIPFDPIFPNSRPEPVPSDPNAPSIIGIDLQDLRAGVEEAYMVNLFKQFTNQDIATTAKTATEALAMKAEQLSLAIVFVKRNIMFLSQIIETLFAIKLRSGDFDEIVDQFPDNYEVDITSPLAKALEGSVEETFFNQMNFIAAVDPVMPWLKHSFDTQAQYTDILINSPLNTKYVKTKKEANDAFEQERQMQQAAQAAEVANLAGDAAAKLQA